MRDKLWERLRERLRRRVARTVCKQKIYTRRHFSDPNHPRRVALCVRVTVIAGDVDDAGEMDVISSPPSITLPSKMCIRRKGIEGDKK
jgi:hypothetical protein